MFVFPEAFAPYIHAILSIFSPLQSIQCCQPISDPFKKMKAWQKLLAQMHKILEEDEENKNYGVRRMQIALEQRGIKRSLSTVRRVMARGNLLHEDRRSPDGLTKADKKAMRPQNIIKQDFSAQEPLRKLLTDITLTPVQRRKAVRITSF